MNEIGSPGAPSVAERGLRSGPPIDYLARDYAGLRRQLLDRLTLLLPNWNETHLPDIGVTLVELLAYVGDHLSYQQDAVATESYLNTARLRQSIRRHARLVDYRLHEGCNARTWLAFTVDGDMPVDLDFENFYVVTALGDQSAGAILHTDLDSVPASRYVGFEACPIGEERRITLRRGRNCVSIVAPSAGHGCLDVGATEAVLVDPGSATGEHVLGLKAGDVLLFEEVLGPHTGVDLDADPRHRHVVRLTSAHPTNHTSPPFRQWHVKWSPEDALPFPLCVSTTSDKGVRLSDVSVARANVVLADHGITREDQELEFVDPPLNGLSARLRLPRVTHAAPIDAARCLGLSAAEVSGQRPWRAVPQIKLAGKRGRTDHAWLPRLDLLSSGALDRHFVVEVDDDSVAWLRFGDNACGRRRSTDETLRADYRTGNGVRGNVGADTLVQLVLRKTLGRDAQISVRNPLPATGGTEPEAVREARLRAPTVFRSRLERAVTASDYSAIVMRDFQHHVQRASATLVRGGAATEARIAIDAYDWADGAEDLKRLLGCIETHLMGFRRVGHDLKVVAAKRVPIAIEMLVAVQSGRVWPHVRAALEHRLGSGRGGLFHPDALSLGEPIRVSRLVAAAQVVPGVRRVEVTRLARIGEADAGSLESGVLPIGPFEVADLKTKDARLVLLSEVSQ